MGGLKRLSHDEAAALLAGAPSWRVTDAIEAWRITKATHWYNQNGSPQAADAGDWLCNDGRAIWSVKATVFADTYEATGSGLYRKRFPVRAVRLDADCIVETLEGEAKARAGDWLVQNRSGECWPVQGWIFEERYERVDAERHDESALGFDLDDLELTTLPKRVLAARGLSVRDLTELTAEDLLAIPGLGDGSVSVIKHRLGRVGLSLRPSPEPEKKRRVRERGEELRDRWFAGETLDQIAASLGVSPERVRQIIYRADPEAGDKRRALRRGGPR